MSQLAFSFDADNVTPISNGFARIGKRYPAADAHFGRHGLRGLNQGTALDYFSNAAARTGWGTPSLTEATQYELVRLSYDYWLMITLYQNHWICRKIVDVPAQDMVRAWPRLTSEIDPKDITRVDRAIRQSKVKHTILETIKWARLFGGAGALMVIEGQENILDEPLDIESVEVGAFKGLIAFDRWSGIYPSSNVATDITRPREFNLPEHYSIQSIQGEQFTVHASRILRFIGPSVPTPEYQAMMYWGISVLEPCFQELRNRDNMASNIINLTYRANLIGMVFPELAQALSGAGMSQAALVQFQTRMQSVNQLMSNQSLVMLPKDGQMTSTNYAFSGMSDMYAQFQMDLAGAADIPVTKLYGRTLTGLGQTGDSDMEIYDQKISMEQENSLRPELDKLYPVICMSELGEVPADLDLMFPSARVFSQKEKYEMSKSVGDNIVNLFGAGIINRPQAMMELKQSSDITELGSNITSDDIDEAIEGEKITPTLQLEKPDDDDEDKKDDKGSGKDSAVNFLEVEFAGLPITIEYQAGERRQIKNERGKVVYSKLLEHDYGFIRGTVGRDGDETDAILGPDENAAEVYIIDMIDLGPDLDKRQNEDKICIGFKDAASAKAAFLGMYAPSFFGAMRVLPIENFRQRVRTGQALDADFRNGI